MRGGLYKGQVTVHLAIVLLLFVDVRPTVCGFLFTRACPGGSKEQSYLATVA